MTENRKQKTENRQWSEKPFYRALEIVLKREGNYVNDKRDAGEETYKGISRHYHPDWEGWEIVDMAKEHSGIGYLKKGDITQLLGSAYQAKLEQLVKNFYFEEFWKKIKGDEIEKIAGFDVALYTFDAQVNPSFGVNGAKLLQMSINKEFAVGLKVDGVIGEKSLAALEEVKNYSRLLRTMKRYRVVFYAKHIAENPEDKVYIAGWIDRALDIA